ncbi:hypothetical protein QQS21_008207 [Conoideocrella luteorostrata]|uniref:Heterokaryon incompatibility domain-containing protein n=1 Tax=Conoideocrella luteorostrata TaxID=1105319 RepID=A0AAJ0FW86_9HYPO|nr:hypothetical protein QQS21_008207 [Conoideocrella luteorostrata]
MRLINVKTRTLESFVGKDVPPYAILSHTWGRVEEEISFHDISTGNIEKAGKIKLEGCCEQAEKDKLGYVWIDTCCIDESSAVELSEAINSMFRWYQQASICYAYLSDVSSGENSTHPGSDFFSSRWFLRGWTLQELLAPQELRFYNQKWTIIGTKRDMSSEIETITGIPWRYLRVSDLYEASVAQRMSWAARRETTREEDIAYCLLGIFGVNMPMIYGEGDRAFIRLQEAIMKNTGDVSILAWGINPREPTSYKQTDPISAGIWATAPSDFANCRRIAVKRQDAMPVRTFDISGGLLRAHLPLHTTAAGDMYGLLNCGPEHSTEQVVGIPLFKAPRGAGYDEYFRPRGYCATLLPVTSNVPAKAVRIQIQSQSRSHGAMNRQYWFHLHGYKQINLSLVDDYPPDEWKKGSAMIAKANQPVGNLRRQYLARLRSKDETSQDFIILLELEIQASQIYSRCHTMISSRDTSLEDLSRGLMYMRPQAFGKHVANNSQLNLEVAVKEEYVAQGPIFTVKLSRASSSPETTVDATLELQQVNLKLEFARILEEEDKVRSEIEQLDRQSQNVTASLARMKERLIIVRETLQELGEEKDFLVDELEKRSQKVDQLTQNRVEVVQQQNKLSKRESEIQKHLNEQGIANWLETVIEMQLNAGTINSGSQDVGYIGPNDSQPLESGRIINTKTPLIWAAEKGYKVVARVLIEQGAAIEAKTGNGSTPLMIAAHNGHEAVARLLIDKGAAIEAKTGNGWIPLLFAAYTGHEAIARLLIDKGAAIEAKTGDGWTPLMIAAENGHEAVARLLIDKGAAIEAKAGDGWTPLMIATDNGHEAAARLLIDKGAAIEAKTGNGWTLLMIAAHNGHKAVARLLIDKGAVIEAKTGNGWTPLMIAAHNGHEAVARLLINKGAAVEAKTSDGWTPLVIAAESGHEAVARLLIDKGAAVEAKAGNGWTPLMIAADNGHEAVARLLIDKGAAIEAKTGDGWTPLMIAAENGHEAVARLLIDKGSASRQSMIVRGKHV